MAALSAEVLSAMLVSRHSLGYGEIVAFLDRHLAGVRRALEIGTGYGVYALYLASRGIDVLGLDIEPRYIEAARARAATLGLMNVRFEVGDALTAPLYDDWDLVVASEVIEHLPDDARLLRRVHASLRPGGRLLLTTPRADAPLHRLLRTVWGRDPVDREKGHFRRYSRARLLRLLTASGFGIEEVGAAEGLLVDALHNSRAGHGLLQRVHRFRTVITILTLADRLSQTLSGPGDHMVAARKPGP